MGETIRYLSGADVAALGLDPATARAAVVAAFRAHGAGRAVSKPKLVLPVGSGHAFQSMCAAWAERGLAGSKWLGTAPVPPGSGLPTVHAVMMLNDHATGRLRAIMDANALTAIRTAAMSAAAAERLARPGSRTLGFVGCGVQARAHLVALLALLPGLTAVHAVSRSPGSTAALLDLARARGLACHVAAHAEAVVRASDVLVTSVPLEPGFSPFLDPAWIPPGAFVSSVDIGRSWLPGLRALDILAVDDHAQQAEQPAVAPGLGPLGSFDMDLSALAAGTAGRRTAAERAMFIFRGFALADLAVAAALLEAAEAAGVGVQLPR